MKENEGKKIEISIEDFKNVLPETSDGEVYVTEERVDRFLVDVLNDAGIEAEMIYEDTSYYIVFPEYDVKAYVTIISLANDPESNLIKAVEYLTDEVNSSEKLQSWYSYKGGKHYINIRVRTEEEVKAMKLPEPETE